MCTQMYFAVWALTDMWEEAGVEESQTDQAAVFGASAQRTSFLCRPRLQTHFRHLPILYCPLEIHLPACARMHRGLWGLGSRLSSPNWFIKMTLWCNSSFMRKLRIALWEVLQKRPYGRHPQCAFVHVCLRSEIFKISSDHPTIWITILILANYTTIYHLLSWLFPHSLLFTYTSVSLSEVEYMYILKKKQTNKIEYCKAITRQQSRQECCSHCGGRNCSDGKLQ